jgi:hypothetical protein
MKIRLAETEFFFPHVDGQTFRQAGKQIDMKKPTAAFQKFRERV